jgi:antitoxin component of MazEF toxin-antitoxin module
MLTPSLVIGRYCRGAAQPFATGEAEMIRKLFRTGNTLAVGVPQTMADSLGLIASDYVEVEVDATAGALLVWPRAARARLGLSSDYVRTVAEFLRDYADALAALEDS